MKYVRNCVSPADNSYSVSASVIYDLLLVKSKLADVSILPLMWISLLTYFVCLRFVFVFVLTSLTLFFFLWLCTLVPLYDFRNK